MLVSLFVSVFGEACSPDPCSLSRERGAPPAACQVRPESQSTLPVLEHGRVEESKLVLEKNVEHNTDGMGEWSNSVRSH